MSNKGGIGAATSPAFLAQEEEARATIRDEQKARQEAANETATAKQAGKTKKFIAKLKPEHSKDKKDEKDEGKDDTEAKKHKDQNKKRN
ncbi:MAG: hypothetical protein Q9195_007151 [Heterodermia aff. obscurata]